MGPESTQFRQAATCNDDGLERRICQICTDVEERGMIREGQEIGKNVPIAVKDGE